MSSSRTFAARQKAAANQPKAPARLDLDLCCGDGIKVAGNIRRLLEQVNSV
jgi:hypothetical protein